MTTKELKKKLKIGTLIQWQSKHGVSGVVDRVIREPYLSSNRLTVGMVCVRSDLKGYRVGAHDSWFLITMLNPIHKFTLKQPLNGFVKALRIWKKK
jgi:hypothetical protein